MDFWHRLPVFRTVAETEHLPTASKRLGLTAPALSRSIKLLEESVGRPLFDREGRRIVLNPAGKAFLRVVRTAMRQVDTALDELHEVGPSGTVTVSSAGMFTPLAVAATVDLVREYPRLRSTRRSCAAISTWPSCSIQTHTLSCRSSGSRPVHTACTADRATPCGTSPTLQRTTCETTRLWLLQPRRAERPTAGPRD